MRIEAASEGIRFRRIARIIGINILLVAILCLGIEGCVRMVHSEIQPLGLDSNLFVDNAFANVPGPRPGSQGRANGALFAANRRGFWAYRVPVDSTRPSWLMLGDSVTMGIGVPPDSTFAGILAGRLDVNVLNPSVVGYASDDYVTVLKALLSRGYAELNIQRVTVFWCLNDIHGVLHSGTDPDQPVRRVMGPILAFIHRNVFTYQWLKAVLFDRPKRYFEHDSRLYSEENLRKVIAQARQIEELCTGSVIQCELVVLPYQYQLRTVDDEQRLLPQRLLSKRVGDFMTVFDPRQYLLERSNTPSDLYLYGDGIHFSAKGHRLIADYLTERVDT